MSDPLRSPGVVLALAWAGHFLCPVQWSLLDLCLLCFGSLELQRNQIVICLPGATLQKSKMNEYLRMM